MHAHVTPRKERERLAEASMRTVIGSILLLLVIVSVAHAENPWVLWSQETATEPGLAGRCAYVDVL
jgi:hypothetical protein